MQCKTVPIAFSALILLLAIPVIVADYPKSAEIRLREYLFNNPNYSAKARPVLHDATGVNVTLRMALYAMIEFNVRDEVLTTASWMEVYWTDERLTWNPADFDGIPTLVLNVEDIWTPNVALQNTLDHDAVRVVSPGRGTVILVSWGYIFLGAPFIVSTQCSVSIRYFPFDTQVCTLTFAPENQLPTVLSVTMEHFSHFPSTISSLEWNLRNTTVYNVATPYPSAMYCIFLQRDPRYYISTIIIPSTVMSLLALATFLAPPDSGERISLGVSMVLGLTVFQLLIADTLPPSSKQTSVLGTYLSTNFSMACLAVPLSLVNINITYKDRKLTILKYGWIRKLLFEVFPRCLSVPSMGKTQRHEMSVTARNSTSGGNAKNDTAKVHPEVISTKNAFDQNASSDPDVPSKKIKRENRHVALVMDRLFFACFLISFVIVVIIVVLVYSTNPGDDINYHCESGFS